MGRHSMVEEPAPRPSEDRTSTGRERAGESAQQRTGETRPRTGESTGYHRAVGKGESTGYHRAVGKAASRRKIAKWPLVAAAMVALVVIGLFAWNWASNVVDTRAEAQAKNCAEGDSTMRVVVAPGAARAVSAAATKWNDARTVVHSHCVHIDVQTVPSDQAFDALTGHVGLDTIGGVPAAWIPEATDWAGRLDTDRPDLVTAPSEPLTAGYTYVCLGGPDLDEVAVRAAQVFRDFLLDPAQKTGT